ncbi:hypothetical protein [Streptomyces sp. NPDC050263]|uniref:hypothetical protein n=1 Tax=Streptomyces sp. NPDC050263 TaxID=3155037 RepID=UPI0034178B82
MPRGRHRHSPPLHRLLPPTAIAGVSLVCAFGPWVFTEPTLLRVLAAAAAATAIVGAVVMRHWDIQAGKQVADLTRARAGDEWRFEERVAELESDLDESRELRVKLEQRLRAKRTELAGLRNEHAALLRRYATAETERASALEGRRLLEIEAAPTPALPAARAAQDDIQAPDDGEAKETAESTEAESTEAVVESDESTEVVGSDGSDESADEEPKAPAAFSPEGSKLFLRAQAALARFDVDGVKAARSEDPADAEAEAAQEDEVRGKPEAVDEHARAAAPHHQAAEDDETPQDTGPANEAPAAQAPAQETDDVEADAPEAAPATAKAGAADAGTVLPEPPLDRGPGGAPVTAPAPAAARAAALVRRPAASVQRPSGHFAVPTAVAYVPAAQPLRRPTAEGGFDFFGTKSASTSEALEAVQNEDLADVVGQEALALHKAESEAEFKPLDEASRGVGQVIDLTAHDETEQIDLQGLRSAVS